jgi:Patched family
VQLSLHKLFLSGRTLPFAMSETQGRVVEDSQINTPLDIPSDTAEAASASTDVSMLDGASLLTSSQASIIDFVAKSHDAVLNWWWTSTEPEIECAVTTCGRFLEQEGTVAASTKAQGVPSLVTTSDARDDQSSLDSNSQAGSSQKDNGRNHPSAATTEKGEMNSDWVNEGGVEIKLAIVPRILQSQQREPQRQVSGVSDVDRSHNKTPPENMTNATTAPVGHQFSFDQSKFIKATSGITETSNGSSTGSSSVGSLDSPDEPKSMSSEVSWKEKWAQLVRKIGDAITSCITTCALLAARNPYICITSTILIAFILITAGLLTNFQLVVDNAELWPPRHSFSYQQSNWYYYESEFNYDSRNIDLVIHADGGNVLTREGVGRVFEAMSVIQGMDDYQRGCEWADLVGDAYQVGQCHEHSVTDFWNRSIYRLERDAQSDKELREIMSTAAYPSGETVDLSRIIGNARRDENGTLVHAQSFLVEFDLPWSNETIEFELKALDALLELKEQWKSDQNNPFVLEVTAYRSYEDEFLRAILLDLPLLPAVFVVVCLFCCLVFWRNDKVQSRCLLGIGAVVCTLLGIMASHGLMFLCGVPFTTSTSMLPFLMFGKSSLSQPQRSVRKILTRS